MPYRSGWSYVLSVVMNSTPKHAAPRAAKLRRGGRHRRRQPFRPSFALKTLGAIMFVTVGSLSTVAASAAPPATSPPSTTSLYGPDTTTTSTTQFDHFDDHQFDHVDDHHFAEATTTRATSDDHHYDAIGRHHSHHVSSGGRTTRRRPHHRRACRRRPRRQYDDGRWSPRRGDLHRHRSGRCRRHLYVYDEWGHRYLQHRGIPSRTQVGCDRNHSAARLLPEPEARLRDQSISQLASRTRSAPQC